MIPIKMRIYIVAMFSVFCFEDYKPTNFYILAIREANGAIRNRVTDSQLRKSVVMQHKEPHHHPMEASNGY